MKEAKQTKGGAILDILSFFLWGNLWVVALDVAFNKSELGRVQKRIGLA